jgi:uncharacterized protein YcbK (DUF882 family)
MTPKLFFSALALLVAAGAAHAEAGVPTPRAVEGPARAAAANPPLLDLVRLDARAFGRSGDLRVTVARMMQPLDRLFVVQDVGLEGVTYRWVPLHGTPPERIVGEAFLSAGLVAPTAPGIWRLRLTRHGEQEEIENLMLITEVPASLKRNGRLNGYHIGAYPAAASGRSDRYAPPGGFIEVTPENRYLPISRHLRLGDFLTKDQFDVWPKYVALDMQLIDKLELVMQELKVMGVRAERLHIMSGFRTPQYNGPGTGGRALLSRHTYGDAADVWVEHGNGLGYIADLNGDGRRDVRDAQVILEAVNRVEQRYPELVGGAGAYLENGARSPFVHIDVRGTRSRW